MTTAKLQSELNRGSSDEPMNAGEPSMAELGKRLAALHEEIRRARQRYHLDDTGNARGSGAGELSGEGSRWPV